MPGIGTADVERAQLAWADALVELADAVSAAADKEEEDVHQRATRLLSELYDVGDGDGRVLFLPEKARILRARTTLPEIVSYYVATNGACGEDCGFARRGWSDVCFDNHKVVVHDARCASAFGRYMLTACDGESVTCDFLFSYVQKREGDLPRIRIHSARFASSDVSFV